MAFCPLLPPELRLRCHDYFFRLTCRIADARRHRLTHYAFTTDAATGCLCRCRRFHAIAMPLAESAIRCYSMMTPFACFAAVSRGATACEEAPDARPIAFIYAMPRRARLTPACRLRMPPRERFSRRSPAQPSRHAHATPCRRDRRVA